MKEKNGLDKRITSSSSYQNEVIKKEKRKTKEKVLNFNKKASKCKSFFIKQGELKIQTYWCKKINKACTYCNCPNLSNNN